MTWVEGGEATKSHAESECQPKVQMKATAEIPREKGDKRDWSVATATEQSACRWPGYSGNADFHLVPVLYLPTDQQQDERHCHLSRAQATSSSPWVTLTVPANIFKLSKTWKTKLPQETVDVCGSRKINLLLESEDWPTSHQEVGLNQALSVKVQKYSKMDTSVRFIY